MTSGSTSSPRLVRLLVAVGLLAVHVSALAATTRSKSAEAKLEHFTDLIVETVPVGESMESFLRRSDYWPLRSAPRNGDFSAVACLRAKLTAPSYRAFIREQVRRYADAFPKLVEADLKLLDSDYGQTFRNLFLEDGTNVIPVTGFDIDAFTKDLSRREAAFVEEMLLNERRYPLRVLLGLGNRLSPRSAAAVSNAGSSRKDAEDLVVSIRSAFISRQLNLCPRVGSEFVVPSERFPDKPLTIIYSVGTRGDAEKVLQVHAPNLEFRAKCNRPYEKVLEFGLARPDLRPPRPDPSSPMTPPLYPKHLLSMNIEGRALINVHLTETGVVHRAQLERSSGNGELDLAALAASADWTFLPATIDGIPTCSVATMPVMFNIKN